MTYPGQGCKAPCITTAINDGQLLEAEVIILPLNKKLLCTALFSKSRGGWVPYSGYSALPILGSRAIPPPTSGPAKLTEAPITALQPKALLR